MKDEKKPPKHLTEEELGDPLHCDACGVTRPTIITRERKKNLPEMVKEYCSKCGNMLKFKV